MLVVVVAEERRRGGVAGDGAGELGSTFGEEGELEGFVLRREVAAVLEVGRARVREAGETVEEESGGLGVVLAESEVRGFVGMRMRMRMTWRIVERGEDDGGWAAVVGEWSELSERGRQRHRCFCPGLCAFNP